MPATRTAGAAPAALAWMLCADAAPTSESHVVERIVPGSPFNGVHGLAFDRNDTLYAGSVVGQRVYKVDTSTGQVDVVVDAPQGEADDLVFLNDGTMVWTAIQQGIVYARSGNGPVREIARIPSINSINVRRSDGRLFVGQVFGGDGVWEIDPAGIKPPRNIVKDPGGFNGFDIGKDGMLYGPLWFRKQVVRIDPDSGAMKVIADGFDTPAAANFDSRGNLYVLDTALGHVIRVDIASGAKAIVARLDTALDNLAIDSRDRIFVSNMADNGIQEIDASTGKARDVVKGELANPADISATGNTVYVADVFAFRSVDARTGKITDLGRAHEANATIGYPVGVHASERAVVLINSDGVVQKYGRNGGTPLASWRIRGARAAFDLPDGNVVALSADGTLARYVKGDGQQPDVIARGIKSSGGFAPSNVSPGVAYALDSDSGDMTRVDLASGKTAIVASGLKNLRSLALRADDSILAIDADRNLIGIDGDTGERARIARDLPQPATLAVGGGDVIYLATTADNSLWRLSPRTVPAFRP